MECFLEEKTSQGSPGGHATQGDASDEGERDVCEGGTFIDLGGRGCQNTAGGLNPEGQGGAGYGRRLKGAG